MARSVLATAPFVQTRLTATLPGSGWTVDPGTGNPIPAPGASVTLMAFLAPDRAAQLRLLPGADETLIPVTGELVTPLDFPAGVSVGSTLTLTWAGVASTLKLTSITPNDLIGVSFGAFFMGEVRRA